MKSLSIGSLKFFILAMFTIVTTLLVSAQEVENNFWNNVQIGGGLGVSFGNGNFSGTLAPSAIYNFNQYLAVGPSLIFSYQSGDFFKSTLYGGSWITLANPIPEIQLSAEFEQLRVNQEIEFIEDTENENFWNSALFVGAGYRAGPTTIGIRYNLLYQDSDRVYATAWNPFVRVYF